MSEEKKGLMLRRVVRWVWMISTGEDLFVMLRQRDSLERLNMIHCEFLEDLEANHPELFLEIRSHQMKRANLNT
jgi:hypothetical protein